MDGKSASYVDGHRSIEDEQEMRARISQGPPFDRDISQDGKSRHATEIANVEKSQSGIFGVDDGSVNLAATPREGFNNKSAIFSQNDDVSQKISATVIDGNEDKKSAAFGDLSSMHKHGESVVGEIPVRGPEMDEDGRSDESEEGVVVDHAPFKGI